MGHYKGELLAVRPPCPALRWPSCRRQYRPRAAHLLPQTICNQASNLYSGGPRDSRLQKVVELRHAWCVLLPYALELGSSDATKGPIAVYRIYPPLLVGTTHDEKGTTQRSFAIQPRTYVVETNSIQT